MTVGRKDDTGKLRWGLLRRSLVGPLESVIRVLMYGASKYGDENWQAVENGKSRYRDALDRHLAEIDKGVLVDPDTGEPHLAHVATNALFLLWLHQQEGTKQPPAPAEWQYNKGDYAAEYAHRGDDRQVEVVLRDGATMKGQARGFRWTVLGPTTNAAWRDIILWRYV